LPHGVLFRDEEAEMRRKLIDHDVIECVLGLGPNLFYNSPMEACVVVCRTAKRKEQRRRILFINAVNEVTRERAQSFLRPEHIERILDAYRGFADIDGLARVATLDEIQANDGSLNIPLYVRPRKNSDNGTDTEEQPLHEVIARWEESSLELRRVMGELFETLGPLT
jgi:type I restriction enzyme M protein